MMDKFKELIDLKTFVTIMVMSTLCYMTIANKIEAQDFLQIATIIIMFYFTKTKKVE